MALPLSAVTLKKTNKEWIIANDHYTANLSTAHFTPKFTMLNKKKVSYVLASSRVNLSGEREKWDGQYCADNDIVVARGTMHFKAKVISQTKDKIVLEFTGSCPGGNVKEVVTWDNSPLVKYDVTVSGNKLRLGSHSMNLAILTGNEKNLKIYPDGKFVGGVWHSNGEVVHGPSWRYAWYGRKKVGVGVIALPGKNLAGIQYAQHSTATGWGNDQTTLSAIHNRLGHYGMNQTLNFKYGVIAGGTPEKAKVLSELLLGKDSRVFCFNYEIGKLVIRPGQTNHVIVDLRNTTAAKQDVTLKTTITYGLDTAKVVDTRKVSLNAGEIKNLEIPLTFPKDAERGVAIRTDLLDAKGKLIESKMDFCSITNYAPRDTGFGIINVGQAYQDGSQNTWNRNFKRNYIGAYEYYCWAPSVIFGLAPKEDKWIPQTEHNYRNVITKKFLKELVNNAHSHGVGVYAWISGLWSYKEAFKRPDWIKYNAQGQPAIYSGRVYANGDRRSVVKPCMSYPDRAEIWAKEMADSVDMFGWDGCRWDWGFVPNTICDPLYHAEKADEWYDINGVPSSKLFPEPDKTGAECLNVWRAVMEKRHPNFIYGTNYSSSKESWELTPEYHKAAARNALVLFEDMLGYNHLKWNTFAKWGNELALRTDFVRPYNAAPVVGAMRGLPQSSVSRDLAEYTAASAGVKWWAGSNNNLYGNVKERGRYFLRFAEWYYDTKFMRPAKCPVTLAKPANVIFDIFTRERKTADGREVVVPIVNMPEENHIICEYHKELPLRKVTLKLAAKKGEKVTAWLMTPEDPEKAVKLEVKNNTVTVPAVKYAAMVLFQCKGGK